MAPTPPAIDHLASLTTAEAARRMGLTRTAVRDMCAAGQLDARHAWEPNGPYEIPVAAVDRWLYGHPTTGSPSFLHRVRNHWGTALLSALIVLASFFAAGISGLADFGPSLNQLYRWHIFRAFPPAGLDETLIMVVRFAGDLPGSAPHAEIARAVKHSARNLGAPNIRVEVADFTALPDDARPAAESLGRFYNASIIVWGDQTEVRTTVSFVNLRHPDSSWADVTLQVIQAKWSSIQPSSGSLFA